MKIGTILCMLFLGHRVQECVPMRANRDAVSITLPNGNKLQTKIKGDEYMHWRTDANDYTIVEGNDGYYYYGIQLPNGRIGTTGIRVDLKSPPSGLSKNIRPTPAAYHEDCVGKICENHPMNSNRKERHLQTAIAESSHETPRKLALNSGTVYNLVIPIRFADHTTRSLPTKQQLTVLMNNNGANATYCPTGSVRDVFKYNSFGKLNLTSVVIDWVTVNGTESYWANGDSGLTTRTHDLIRMALKLADPYVDFRQFNSDGDGYIDAITFLHSGYGAEWGDSGYINRMWSHKWAIWSGSGEYISAEGVKVYDYHISPAMWGTFGNSIGRVGVIAHETGHFFGLPDMYDEDYSGEGLGSWELMANSWGFLGDQLYPPHMTLYSRLAVGWDNAPVINASGVYNLSAAGDQNPLYPRGYKITYNFPSGEYLLIENRQALYFDAKIPKAGIMIYHVDTKNIFSNFSTEGYPGMTGWPANGKHYTVAILAPDGRYDLEKGNNTGDSGDVWAAGSGSITYSTGSDPKLGPNFPNTDSYQSGIITKTYITISNITAGTGNTLSFRVKLGLSSVTNKPTSKPTSKPVASPRPTNKPTKKPTIAPVASCLASGTLASSASQCCSAKLVCG